MDDFSNLSQYRDVLSEMVRQKVVGQYKIKKWLGQPFFWLLFFGCSKKSNTPSRAEHQRKKLSPTLQAKAYIQTSYDGANYAFPRRAWERSNNK